jgi:hypothetical protein
LAIISNLKKELGGKCIMSNIADTRGCLETSSQRERERCGTLAHCMGVVTNFPDVPTRLLNSKGCGFHHNMPMMTGMCCMKCLQWTMHPKCLHRESEREREREREV